MHIERQRPPIPALAAAARATAPFPLPKVPVRTDQFWTFKPQAGDQPTFPAVTLQVYSDSLRRHAVKTAAVETASAENADPATPRVVPSSAGHRGAPPPLVDRMRARRDAYGTRPDERVPLGGGVDALRALYAGAPVRYLNFYGPAGHLTHLSYDQALRASAVQVRDKAVFVGLAEFDPTLQRDTYPTVYSNPRGIDLSGVEIGATAFANLLEGSDLRRL